MEINQNNEVRCLFTIAQKQPDGKLLYTKVKRIGKENGIIQIGSEKTNNIYEALFFDDAAEMKNLNENEVFVIVAFNEDLGTVEYIGYTKN